MDLWEYNPETGAWIQLESSSSQTTKLYQRAVASEGQIFVTGGLEESSGNTSGETWAYNPNDNTWSQKADLPSPRYGHATFYHEFKIYVTGGRRGDELLNDMWVYSIKNNSWEKVNPTGSPQPVKSASYTANGEVLLMSGGVKYENGNLVDAAQTWEYNIQGNNWTQKKDGPAFQIGSAAMVNSTTRSSIPYQILFFGGARNNAKINETWLYDSSATSSCSTTDNDLNVNVACVNYNTSQYQANLSLVTHPKNSQSLLWKLVSATNIIHSDSDNCASLDSEFTLQFNCVLVNNNPYQAQLNVYTHPTDSSGIYWTLGSATEK